MLSSTPSSAALPHSTSSVHAWAFPCQGSISLPSASLHRELGEVLGAGLCCPIHTRRCSTAHPTHSCSSHAPLAWACTSRQPKKGVGLSPHPGLRGMDHHQHLSPTHRAARWFIPTPPPQLRQADPWRRPAGASACPYLHRAGLPHHHHQGHPCQAASLAPLGMA